MLTHAKKRRQYIIHLQYFYLSKAYFDDNGILKNE